MRHTTADHRARALLAPALAMIAVAACGEAGSDKAGGERTAAPTVLTMANGNGDSRELEPFAAAVARLSGGTLRISFQNGAHGGTRDFERRVIAGVKAGTTALGSVGTRALDDVGVAAFDALHAPLLIDSYKLQDRVLKSRVASEMLAGLEPAGVVGLGILPGPLRKPLGVTRLVRPQDFSGRTIAFQRSQVAEQTLRALGARGAQLAASASVESYDGVEQQIESIAGNRYDRTATFLTANVNLWPRPLVIVMNPEALDALTVAQQSALRRAARAAGAATLAVNRAGEQEGIGALCRRGATFLTATEADLGALRRAVRPVYDRLERDAQTKAAIVQIRAMGSAAASPPEAPACSASDRRQPAASAKASPIDGVYRSDITLGQLRRTPGYDSGENHPGNVGRFKMELREGRFRITGSSDGVDQEGTFSLKGDVLRFQWNEEGAFSYRWSLYRGALTLRKTGEGPTFFAVHPWRRIDDTTSVGRRTPLDGVYRVTTTKDDLRATGSPDIVSENYGRWEYVFNRGLLRYTQSSEGASRWTAATYTVKDDTLAFTVTGFGGEAPNGAAEKTGELFTFRWSLYRDQLTFKPVEGKISPEPFYAKPMRRIGDAP